MGIFLAPQLAYGLPLSRPDPTGFANTVRQGGEETASSQAQAMAMIRSQDWFQAVSLWLWAGVPSRRPVVLYHP
jgi:hypothetical protein